EDLHDVPAIGQRKPGVHAALLPAREQLPETLVHGVLRQSRQRVERVGVDHVAAGIPHQAPLEADLAERSALAVYGTGLRELLRKAWRTADTTGKRGLIDKQHVVDELLSGVLDRIDRRAGARPGARLRRRAGAPRGGGDSTLPTQARQEVGHVGLM